MKEGGLIESMLDSVDDILSVRDSMGASLKKVFLVTRSWTGEGPGDGEATESTVQILPTPGFKKDLGRDLKIKEGGLVKQGDEILRGISKKSYPSEEDIDCITGKKNIEKFYLIDDELYTVINVIERHLTWDVHIRKLSDQRRY